MIQFSSQILKLEQAVRAAGKHLWEQAEAQSPLQVTVKADNTLVLNLDMESHKIMLTQLAGKVPIVSEEDESTHGLIDTAEEYFVIDPLDGTTSCKRFLSTIGGQIGFGPLGGYVKNRVLQGAVFFHVPQRTLFIAERGVGSFSFQCGSRSDLDAPVSLSKLRKLSIDGSLPLIESAVLFFAGTGGETRVIEYFRHHNVVENVYRFGGFANDCSRLAQNTEQLQVQFSVKAWDLSAALIAELAGLSVVLDPKGRAIPLHEWKVTHANPLISCHPEAREEVLEIVKAVFPS